MPPPPGSEDLLDLVSSNMAGMQLSTRKPEHCAYINDLEWPSVSFNLGNHSRVLLLRSIFTRLESARTLHHVRLPRNAAKDRWLLARYLKITVRRRFVYVLPIADNGSRWRSTCWTLYFFRQKRQIQYNLVAMDLLTTDIQILHTNLRHYADLPISSFDWASYATDSGTTYIRI